MSVEYLKLSDPMYEQIETIVRETFPHSCIVWIEQIKNEQLEQKFKNYCSTLTQPNIKRLFHGTSEEIARIIIQEGFDPSKNKTSAHGLGCYFSTRAAYSKNYCHQTSGCEYVFMLLCDVATGKVCKGVCNQPIPVDFDSATDNLKRPDMYIVNKRDAIQPLYLISFYPKV